MSIIILHETFGGGSQKFDGNIAAVRWITKTGVEATGDCFTETSEPLEYADYEETRTGTQISVSSDGVITNTTGTNWDNEGGVISIDKIAAEEDGFMEFEITDDINYCVYLHNK